MLRGTKCPIADTDCNSVQNSSAQFCEPTQPHRQSNAKIRPMPIESPLQWTAPRPTQRLILRRWCAADREPFAQMTADPQVMRLMFPGPLSRQESDALVDRIEAHFDAHGFGMWALEIPGITTFAGFVGLSVPAYQAHFTPCVEVGWRIAHQHWGQGYATEAAAAALAFGFDVLALLEIVALTVPNNQRSRRVMEKLGMAHDQQGDFEHPLLPSGHALRRHVLYRKSAMP